MKVIKVIVDETPGGCYKCEYYHTTIEANAWCLILRRRLNKKEIYQYSDTGTELKDCPLVAESEGEDETD